MSDIRIGGELSASFAAGWRQKNRGTRDHGGVEVGRLLPVDA